MIFVKKGIALIALIIIITVVVITVGGIVSFIANGIALATVQSARSQALYAAQAGIYAAIYDFEAVSYPRTWSKASNVSLAGSASYSVGKDANFMLIDASHPRIGDSMWLIGGVRYGPFASISDVRISNSCADQAITIDRIKIEWYNANNASMVFRGIVWGGLRFYGTASSGTIVTLNPACQINANSGTNALNLWFSHYPGTNSIIIATFFCTDGSQRKSILFNEGYSGNKEFSVTSTGTISGNVNVKRTIEATYDYGCKNITSWREVPSHI